MSEFEVGLRLRADGKGLTGQLRLTKDQVRQLNSALDDTQKSGRKAGDGLDGYGKSARTAEKNSSSLKKQANNLSREFSSLKGILATLGIAAVGRSLISTSAQMQEIDTRIRRLSGSTANYVDDQRFLIQTARETRRELTVLSKSYADLLALENAGIITRTEARELLDGMVDAQAALGASNVALAQSMFGMQQGFSSNILRAEELNQVVEPLTGLLARLDRAADLDSGGFRRMVNEGQVTADFFKETMLEALDQFEGATEETFDNLTQLWTGVRNEYTNMATKLQEPLTSGLAPLASVAEATLGAFGNNMPFVLDTLSKLTDLVMVGGSLYLGLKTMSFLIGATPKVLASAKYALDALIISKELGVSVFQFYTSSTLAATTATKAFSTSIRLAIASLMQVAAAFTAGFIFGDFLNNFQIVRTVAIQFVGLVLRQFEEIKFAGKALWLSFQTSFDVATSGIKKGYAELLEFIGSGLDLIGADQLAAAYNSYAADLRAGADVESTYRASLSELNQEREKGLAQIKSSTEALLAMEAAGMDTVNTNRNLAESTGQVGDTFDDTGESTSAFSAVQEELINKLIPLRAAQLDYETSLQSLNEIVPKTTEEMALKEQALANLKTAYAEQVRELNGSLEREKEALKLQKEQASAISNLVGNYLPLLDAEQTYREEMSLLTVAVEEGAITAEQYTVALKAINEGYEEIINPAGAYLDKLKDEVSLLEAENDAIRTGNYQRLAEIELRRQGVEVTDEQIASMAELLRRQQAAEASNRVLNDQSSPFAEAWEQSFERVDRAMFNWIRSGLDDFKSFKQATVDMAKDLAAELILIFGRQKLLGSLVAGGGLSFSGAAAAGTGTGGTGGGFSLSSALGLASGAPMLPALLSNSALTASNALYGMGFDGLANVAGQRAFDTTTMSNFGAIKDLGLSIGAGIAGDFVGGKLGGALFGKTAESNIGSTALGAAGSVIGGPLGAFIGSTIGSMIDTAFGGDGAKAVRAGLLVNPAANAANSFSVSQFASGFAPTGFAERAGQDVANQVIDIFRSADAQFADITRASGRTIDYSQVNFNGMNGQATPGSSGLFYGLSGENGLPSTEVLADQVMDFTRQLIDHAPDLRTEIRDILQNTTGDVDTLLARYRDLLALDSVFGEDAPIFSDIASFEDTFTILSETLRREGESLAETATRVGQSMALLQQIGVGDTSSTSASFANQVEEQLGLATLQTLVSEYNTYYVSEAERLGAAIDSLSAVAEAQFQELGLTIDSFSLQSFRAHFDAVKDSLDAVDLSKYLQAAVSLGQLTDLREKESDAINNTSDALSNSAQAFEAFVDDTERLVNQARQMRLSIEQDIYTAQGATPLFPELGVGSIDDRLSAVQELRRLYQQQHADQIANLQSLHDLEMSQYRERLAAAMSLDQFVRDLDISELAPVSASERLSRAGQEFNRLVDLARSTGDGSIIGDVENAAKTRLNMARAQFTSGQGYVDIYNETKASLNSLRDHFDGAVEPSSINTTAADNLLVSQLESLRTELISVEQQSRTDVVDQLVLLNQNVNNLSKSLQAQLESITSTNLVSGLNIANSFGLLKSEVVAALDLQPKTMDLSQEGIANALESLTSIGDMSEIFGSGFQSLAEIIGSVSQTLVSQGVSTHLLADLIAQNSTLTSAANTYLSTSGSGKTIADYQSKTNTDLSTADIQSQIASHPVGDAGATSLIQWAKANNVGSSQLSQAGQDLFPGITQQEIIEISERLGLGSFRSGTDRITKDGLNFNHVDEIIFSPTESNSLRRKVIDIVGNQAGGPPQLSGVVEAIRVQTELMERISDEASRSDHVSRSQLAELIVALQDEMEALRRQVEEMAA